MKYFQEVTKWSVDYVPNHVYYLTDDKRKMVGYIPAGKRKLVKFSKPMSFDSRGRKLVALDRKAESDEVYFPKTETKSVAASIEIVGSSGKSYYLTKTGSRWVCTCPGFQFRHKCRHIEQAGN
jgi:hypothetical protein